MRLLHPTESGLVAGTDEAGRGSLAGPVTAAAVLWPKGLTHPWLNDSKKMSYAQRQSLAPWIKENAISWGISFVSAREIDQINILQASIKAMHLSLDQLVPTPDFVLVDGNRFTPWREVPYRCEIKGDGRFLAIAAASVLAKTERDAYMEEIHLLHPEYGWKKNKGYGTKEHRDAMAIHGQSPHHRLSFKLKSEQLSISFDNDESN
ncbi:MAG: ribonuclease HII [Flavobacteriaceae bacterium]